ncbi:DUF4232 domain-containing protein [Streptomyces sp. NPDC058439]|uniref:DUF4232 domain-containing protein n=1 Tax=Streptomyces sp. NPDC058439 TaxID=3346500 RepID=UPI00366284C6
MRTINRNRNRNVVLGAAATAALALALTACGGEDSGTKAADPANGATPAAASRPADAAEADDSVANTGTAQAVSAGKGTAKASGGNTDTDSYAYTHPCKSQKLSVHVTGRAGAATQRVIEVRNLGASACGLSHFPRVSLGNSHSADHSKDVRPLVPSGLGGAPAYPVRAGKTAYAVIDVNPCGATTGTVAGIDEMNVLADDAHMPNAETHNFPLGSGAKVLKPKLGLYRSTIADAVSSMTQADTQS